MSSPDRQRDLELLLDILSVPRPNGSAALRETASALRQVLSRFGIPYSVQKYPLNAYFNEILGAWLIITSVTLLVGVLARWGWPTLAISLLFVLIPFLETGLLVPIITGIVRTEGENLICAFPVPHPAGEVILTAHYDSKTELLDPRQRRVFIENSRPASALTLMAGVASALDRWLATAGSPWAMIPFGIALICALLVVIFGVGFGGNLLLGRWRRPPSQGAVDNGAAVAVLIELCRRLAQGQLEMAHTTVTIVLFSGEEVQMQGSRRYVAEREAWPLPTRVINLEAMGQDGDYVLWEQDGTAFNRYRTDPELNASLESAIRQVTGRSPQRLPLVNSDAMPFLRAGIPAAVLGSLDSGLGMGGLHSPLDRRERVHLPRVLECVDILVRWLRAQDVGPASNHANHGQNLYVQNRIRSPDPLLTPSANCANINS